MPCSRRCASSRSNPAEAAAGLAAASSRITATVLTSTCDLTQARHTPVRTHQSSQNMCNVS